MRTQPALRISHVERIPASESLGMLRLHGEWSLAAAGEPLELIAADARVEQLPEPPNAAPAPAFRAAFPVPIERLDDPGAAWSVATVSGESIRVAWPEDEGGEPPIDDVDDVAAESHPDAAASVAQAAAEALLRAREEGAEQVRLKEVEIERLRDVLSESEARAEELESELRSTLDGLAAALETAREAEGVAAASHAAMAREQERDDTATAARIEELEGLLTAAQGETEAARSERDAATAELDAVRSELERERAAHEPARADREDGDLHRRVAELEAELRVSKARATSLESELATLDDDIRVERSSIVGVEDAAGPVAPRRKQAPRPMTSPGDREAFAERLQAANRAVERVQDRG
ncbi:MAG TPA: hypothetical protein VF545_02020 [Thermoleophilaceae bacterium]|jgi:hypothetical protein